MDWTVDTVCGWEAAILSLSSTLTVLEENSFIHLQPLSANIYIVLLNKKQLNFENLASQAHFS